MSLLPPKLVILPVLSERSESKEAKARDLGGGGGGGGGFENRSKGSADGREKRHG
jgi:hypothetical protein